VGILASFAFRICKLFSTHSELPLPPEFLHATQTCMLQAGPASRMSPTFMTQLNACLVVKLAGSMAENENQVVEWRQKGLTDLSAGIYLKVGSNIVFSLNSDSR
jgi:hypothetical protein